MAYISNQWLKGGGKGYQPVSVQIKSYPDPGTHDSWVRDHEVVHKILFCKEDLITYKCKNDDCSFFYIEYDDKEFSERQAVPQNVCYMCGSNIGLDSVTSCSEYQVALLTQGDIESILPDLLVSASEKSKIDILKSIIPNVDISDELKLELISLLSKKQ